MNSQAIDNVKDIPNPDIVCMLNKAEAGTTIRRLKLGSVSNESVLRLSNDHKTIIYKTGRSCVATRFKRGKFC